MVLPAHLGTDVAAGDSGTITRAIPAGYHHLWCSGTLPLGSGNRTASVVQLNGDADPTHYQPGDVAGLSWHWNDVAERPYGEMALHNVDGGHGQIAALLLNQNNWSQEQWREDAALESIALIANPDDAAVHWSAGTVFDWWGV